MSATVPSRFLFVCTHVVPIAQAQVYRALDPQNTPLNVAIKKSRASTRLRRTHLKHEVHVLQLLRGHPAIPRVVAYGHLEHFEYLALELLGQSLNDVVPKQGMEVKMVARIAVSLVRHPNVMISRAILIPLPFLLAFCPRVRSFARAAA